MATKRPEWEQLLFMLYIVWDGGLALLFVFSWIELISVFPRVYGDVYALVGTTVIGLLAPWVLHFIVKWVVKGLLPDGGNPTSGGE